uniref:PHP domain-containing protein n=1 Tax=Streptomyces europaeiscabiei TaxID=146819 RepID=UPI0038F7A6BD
MKRDGSKKEGVTEMPFVHLQVHSGYSLLNSAASGEDLTAKAKELGYSAMALTDDEVMYGAVEFYKSCKKRGIKPIIGL